MGPTGGENSDRATTRLGSRRLVAAAEVLRRAADTLPADAKPDRYGEGEVVEDFEQRIANVLGKPSAALLLSGTMAQQAAELFGALVGR